MIDKAPPQPEFSRPFDTAELGEQTEQRLIETNADECRALAERFGVLGIATLKAELTIKRLAPGLVQLEGRLEAKVSQQCVVTLDPVESAIDERFAVTYAGATPHEDGVRRCRSTMTAKRGPIPSTARRSISARRSRSNWPSPSIPIPAPPARASIRSCPARPRRRMNPRAPSPPSRRSGSG